MFNEEEHPRDKDGKFTFKNGGSVSIKTNDSAQILYGKKIKEESNLKEKRNELLKELNGKLTPAQILYSSNKELEKLKNDFKIGKLTGGADYINDTHKYIRPVEGKIISNFGPRNTTIGSRDHKGIDLRAPIGTPVKTIAGGKVTVAQSGIRGYGTAVYIDHGIINGKKVVSVYGHLSKCDVKVGDKVKPGQIIAKSGNTGVSQAPHLHVTILENGKAVDPRKYLK